MSILLAIFFWISFGALLHTYVIYPFLLKIWARGKKENEDIYREGDEWPRVSIMLSVYNEESVIKEKIDSFIDLDYPKDKLLIYIGSDCSSDRTNEIVQQYAEKHAFIRFFPFQERRGKPGVVNELHNNVVAQWGNVNNHLIIVTDASVIMSPSSLREMAKHFKNDKIGLVDSHILHTGMQEKGISRSENQYISGEALLKHREGLIWGKMIGPFGGCYAIRAPYFTKVPANFLVDDFYITMRMFEKGMNAINELGAICYEGVSHEISEEYRRKRRISSGNFQNLTTFPHLWWPPFRPLQFAFFSHKVLRWFGPFWGIIMLLSALGLSLQGNLLYSGLLVFAGLFVLVAPTTDYLLNKLGVNILLLRSIRYFILMNLALLEGFIKYVKGIKSNVWEPTKRN